MAGQLKFTGTLVDTDPFGAKDPISKTITVSYTKKEENNHYLDTTSPVVAWDPGNASSPVTTAAAFYALADGDGAFMSLGATSSSTATDGAVFMAIPIAADAPFFLGADDSFTPTITSAAFHTTQGATVIDQVKLLNSTTTPVTVRLVIVG